MKDDSFCSVPIVSLSDPSLTKLYSAHKLENHQRDTITTDAGLEILPNAKNLLQKQ